MNHRYIKNDIDKTKEFYKLVNSINITSKDYRDIFEDGISYEYGDQLDEYYERNINAIMVNNIRHNCSNYDKSLKQMRRINRSDNDYYQYKNCVLEKISNKYPYLKDECYRQKRKIDLVKIIQR